MKTLPLAVSTSEFYLNALVEELRALNATMFRMEAILAASGQPEAASIASEVVAKDRDIIRRHKKKNPLGE